MEKIDVMYEAKFVQRIFSLCLQFFMTMRRAVMTLSGADMFLLFCNYVGKVSS